MKITTIVTYNSYDMFANTRKTHKTTEMNCTLLLYYEKFNSRINLLE